jgi:hypothetical protein
MVFLLFEKKDLSLLEFVSGVILSEAKDLYPENERLFGRDERSLRVTLY